jgi:hypothetical protein
MTNGNSDVKLVNAQVKVEAWDLCLDGGKDRRKNDTPQRRALVHDFDDGLTLNWDGDYPGGVTINGTTVRVAGKFEVSPFFPPQPTDAPTRSTPTGKILSAEESQKLLKTVGSKAVGDIKVSPFAFIQQYIGSAPNDPIDVIGVLGKLAQDVMKLKAQTTVTP